MTVLPIKKLRLRKAIASPDSVRAELCKRSLFYFMRTFWDEVSSDTPSWNWHIPYICAQLMNVAHRVALGLPKQHDLVINIPPGTTKSLTCSVMFPVWCWTNWPWMRFITASYSAALSLELAEYSRDVLRSNTFRRLFPDFEVKRDKDTKSNFRIQQKVYDEQGALLGRKSGGNRYSTSVGGTLTGFHGHILVVDDPIDPTSAGRGGMVNTANRWLDQTLSTRKINKAVTPTILIMQRLSQDDPAGHILEKGKESVFHISLPGETKSYHAQVQPPDLVQYYEDGLLDPARMPWNVLKDMELDLGQYGYAGQIGQSPTPPSGGMFKPENIAIVDDIPASTISGPIRYWDKAGTAGGGAYTAGAKMAKLETGQYLILHMHRGQWGTERREKEIQRVAHIDGPRVRIFMEQEPGSSGIDSVKSSIRGLDGFNVKADRPTGDKVVRADPFSVQVNNGGVLMLRGDWNQAVLDEMRYFPFSKYKDQIDALSGAYTKLYKPKVGVW